MNFYFVFEGKTEPIIYKKWFSIQVQEEDYLLQLLKRIKEEPSHLKSFQEFINFCKKVENFV